MDSIEEKEKFFTDDVKMERSKVPENMEFSQVFITDHRNTIVDGEEFTNKQQSKRLVDYIYRKISSGVGKQRDEIKTKGTRNIHRKRY